MTARPETPSVPKAVRPRYEEIIGLTDAVCYKHLNEEYAELARVAAARLARKRPPPIVQGRASSWACGIVYAIGRLNFLFDKTEEPYMGASALCALFEVSVATGSAKGKAVLDALGAFPMDPRWSTSRVLAANPLVWFVEIDGLLFDARQLPRSIQEELVSLGMIPYVPESQLE
jgi:hypothetical protein